MKTTKLPEGEPLSELLRRARPTPALPPRFVENVWRRIEAGEATSIGGAPGWLMGLAGWFLKPRHAAVLVAIVVLAGAGLGWNQTQQGIHTTAQARYLAAVAPNSLR